ncbi:G-protein coupled receptor 84-like isoform X2 [Gadus macrocephalus]|uniref:G-protein coupled receptor 84-like isoform X2 n=1 Tax=Gadus macrocephalus TaxID=80720 RepID=UPI0028CBB385|nr:G-protein coupled receptor 84-like isoform X2 [Gadus macrocephalus]
MEPSAWRDASTRNLTHDWDSVNQTYFSCYHPLVVEYRYFAVLWGCLVTITGTVGNLMTVLAFATDPCIRTRFNVLIVNLALVDLLYCALLRPVVTDSYLHLRWRGGALGCRAFGLLLYVTNAVSILTLCLIAVSRYLLVQRRSTFERLFSARGLLLLLPSTWALGLASYGPLWPVYVFVPLVCACSFHGTPYTTVLFVLYFLAGLFCVGVFYLLIYRRVRLAARAVLRHRPSRRSSRKRVAPAAGTEDDSGVGSGGGAPTCTSEVDSQGEPPAHRAGATWYKEPGEPQPTRSALDSHTARARASPEESATTPSATTPPALTPPSTTTPPTSLPSTSPPSKTPPSTSPPSKTPPSTSPPSKTPPSTTPPSTTPPHATQSSGGDELKRVTRMCFAVFLCFVFCFVPFMLLNMADQRGRAPQILHMFCANLTWLNSCINPLLYAVMNPQFRRSYHLLLTRAFSPLGRLWRALWNRSASC